MREHPAWQPWDRWFHSRVCRCHSAVQPCDQTALTKKKKFIFMFFPRKTIKQFLVLLCKNMCVFMFLGPQRSKIENTGLIDVCSGFSREHNVAGLGVLVSVVLRSLALTVWLERRVIVCCLRAGPCGFSVLEGTFQL